MNSKALIAVNTGILYVKLIITTVLSLFATRILLEALGEIDFGVSALVSSVIAMLAFLSASLTVSTQRYMSFNLGKNDIAVQNTVFSTSFTLHLFIGIIIAVFLLFVTPLIFSSIINIPVTRIGAAKFIYICTIVTTFLVIITIPYDAVLNAHENMLAVAIVNIIESTIKLGGIYTLLYIKNDKLILYGCILLLVQVISSLVKIVYCHLKYPETHFRKKYIKKKMMNELFSFSIWNSVGAIAVVGRSQGLAVIMNIFTGVIANTAYGIANQVSGLLNTVSSYLQKAMNPQIMKQEGAGDHAAMTILALNQCKYTFILLLGLGLPIIFVMELLLRVWLGNFPMEAILFCKLMVIIALVKQLGTGLQVAIQAVGNIRTYQICASIIILSSLVIAYYLLYIKFPAYYALLSVLMIEGILLFIRPWFAYKYAGISTKSYFIIVVFPVLGITTIAVIFSYLLYYLMKPETFLISLVFIILSFLITILSYIPFMNHSEKIFIKSLGHSILNKIHNEGHHT